MTCPKQENPQRQKADKWLPGAGGMTAKSFGASPWSDINVLKLATVMGVQTLLCDACINE